MAELYLLPHSTAGNNFETISNYFDHIFFSSLLALLFAGNAAIFCFYRAVMS